MAKRRVSSDALFATLNAPCTLRRRASRAWGKNSVRFRPLAESAIREGIKRLRSEIVVLQSQPAYGSGWQSWYQNTCSLLSSHYGVESPELRGFLEIRFEIQTSLLEAEDALQSAVREVLPSVPVPLRIS